MEWQDIATAPMDSLPYASTDIPILFTDGASVAVGYVAGKYAGESAWCILDALSERHELYGRDPIGFTPTHWMPLPLPPPSEES